MKINESLKTVSTTSKIVAIVFFGVLAVIAFFVGAWFQRNIDITNQVSAKVGNPISGQEAKPTPVPTTTPTINPTAKVTTKPTVVPTATPKPSATPTPVVQVNL